MTKKLLLTVCLSLALAGTLYADNEIELGFGVAPYLGSEAPQYEGFFYNNTAILHAGYSFAWLFYLSADALVLPPAVVEGMTGISLPGILGLADIGIRPTIGPLMIMAAVGINGMYVYNNQGAFGFGANIKAGLGIKVFKWLSVNASGIVAFADFEEMTLVLSYLANPDSMEMAAQYLLSRMYPALTVNLIMK